MTYNYKPAGGIQLISDTDPHQLAAVSDAYYEIRIQNRAHNNQNDASNGDSILIGTREQLVYELVSGSELKMYQIAPANLYFQQLGSASGFIVVAWIASGKVDL